MSQQSRVFVAVDLPEGTRKVVASHCKGLPPARWCKPDQLHLTLHFAAAVSAERLTEITERLATVKAPPFPLSLRGLGVFPAGQPQRARVLWAGVAPEEGLRALQAAVDAALGPDEDPEAREGFTPHLTLARFRSPPGPALARFMHDNAVFATAPWTVEGFALYRSNLSSDGALHTLLRQYPLAA
jgi:2'-5' RNA ligase